MIFFASTFKRTKISMKIIKNYFSSNYYVISSDQIKPAFLTPSEISSKIGLLRWSDSQDLDKDKFNFGQFELRGKTYFINPRNAQYKIAKFDFIEEPEMIAYIKDIYKNYETSEKLTQDFYQYKRTNKEWVQVKKLTGVDGPSDPVLEILLLLKPL